MISLNRHTTVAAAIVAMLLMPTPSTALIVDSTTPAFELFQASSEDGMGFDCGMYFLREKRLPTDLGCKSVSDKLSA